MSIPPIKIRFMLAHFISSEPRAVLGEHEFDSVGGQETREWLLNNGLVDSDGRVTARGHVWVDMLCSTPLPVQAWLSPSDLAKLALAQAGKL